MTDPRRAIRSPRPKGAAVLPAWGAICFFLSGVAGLLYEVVWTKELGYLLGNSLQATATVVAAFLGGLALGAYWLGVPLARRGRGPRTYALLELGVLALGLASVPVLRGLDAPIGALYRAFGGEGAAFGCARLVGLVVLLLPPAALMGATLPVLVGHFERDRVGPGLARLYALNTLGAVAGSMLGGFALLPAIGLAATTWVAAALNASVALVAWRVRAPAAPVPVGGADSTRSAIDRGAKAAGERSARRGAPAARASEPPALAGSRRHLFAALFALSGFAALAFQIAWVRLFGLMFGSSVYSFSAVLAVYLTGLALGSALAAPALRRGVSLTSFASLQVALAVAAALALHAFTRLPEWMFALTQRPGIRWADLFAGEVAMCAALLLAPCAMLGAVFPVATRLLQVRDGGHATGFAYAMNTLGTIAGSLAAGFVLVPRWGVQGTHVAALALSAAVGLAAIAMTAPHPRKAARFAFVAGGAALAAALVILAPRWDPMLMSAGLFRPIQAMNMGLLARYTPGAEPTVRRATRQQRVLFYREGVNASVLVGSNEDGKDRWLRVGGKVDASTSDMQTQALLGLLPAACADSGARTLVIGLGSGITASGVLAAGAGITDVVELEPAVVEASRFFHAHGEHPLDDPRVRLVLGDARTHLAHGGGRFGLIVSEPSNPWIAGVNNLFTVDFYRRVRARLEPRGVFCQWMQLYELSPETFASMLASFLEVFPDGEVFSVWGANDVLLIAMPAGNTFALERLRTPAARRLLERARISSPEEVAGYWAGSFGSLKALARGAALNRDDRPVVEYRAPRDLIEVGRIASAANLRVAGPVPFEAGRPAGLRFAAWTSGAWFVGRVRGLLAIDEDDRARQVVRAARDAGLDSAGARLDREVQAAARSHRAAAERERAKFLYAGGQTDAARAALERAVSIDPADWLSWAMLAEWRYYVDDLPGAEAALERARAVGTPEALGEAALVAGTIELHRQRPLIALERFRETERRVPHRARAYLLEANTLRDGGDLAGARAALKRGLQANPDAVELSDALARLGSPP
jgi:spermidine synthase